MHVGDAEKAEDGRKNDRGARTTFCAVAGLHNREVCNSLLAQIPTSGKTRQKWGTLEAERTIVTSRRPEQEFPVSGLPT